MSTFTKEQLIEQAKKNIEVLRGAVDRIPGASDAAVIHLKLAEITLASLEAEAVGFIVRNKETGKFGSWMHSKADWFKDDGYEVMSAYIAPPAPVSVPKGIPDSVFDVLSQACGGGGKACDFADELWNACRAAMLNGEKS